MFWTNVVFFLFLMSYSCLFLNECNCCASHIVYFHNIVLPFLMSVECVAHFVVLPHVWMSGFHLWLKMPFYLHRTMWMWRRQHPCLFGEAGPVLWWETVLWSACALNIACEHKLDVWTITAFKKSHQLNQDAPTLWDSCWHLKCVCQLN